LGGGLKVDGKIWYLNTDLDLASAKDLTALAAAFQKRGMYSLHVSHNDDGMWYATLETEEQHDEPESNIAAMLVAIESLAGSLRTAWRGCTRREFNIGYDCGEEPWGFNQALSPGLLARVAKAGASVRITIYPEREP
jgi:hypothetical protein